MIKSEEQLQEALVEYKVVYEKYYDLEWAKANNPKKNIKKNKINTFGTYKDGKIPINDMEECLKLAKEVNSEFIQIQNHLYAFAKFDLAYREMDIETDEKYLGRLRGICINKVKAECLHMKNELQQELEEYNQYKKLQEKFGKPE